MLLLKHVTSIFIIGGSGGGFLLGVDHRSAQVLVAATTLSTDRASSVGQFVDGVLDLEGFEFGVPKHTFEFVDFQLRDTTFLILLPHLDFELLDLVFEVFNLLLGGSLRVFLLLLSRLDLLLKRPLLCLQLLDLRSSLLQVSLRVPSLLTHHLLDLLLDLIPLPCEFTLSLDPFGMGVLYLLYLLLILRDLILHESYLVGLD